MFQKEIDSIIGYKNIKTNTFRIQASNSVMRGFFCIGLIDFMFAGKNFIFKKNSYFQNE